MLQGVVPVAAATEVDKAERVGTEKVLAIVEWVGVAANPAE